MTALDEFKAIRNVLRVPFPEDMKDLTPPEFPQDRRWKGLCLGYSYSTVSILSPQDRSAFNHDAEIKFEGQITRSSETNWEDHSDQLVWRSHLIEAPLGTGRCLKTCLQGGTHVITARWPAKDREDSIVIYVRSQVIP